MLSQDKIALSPREKRPGQGGRFNHLIKCTVANLPERSFHASSNQNTGSGLNATARAFIGFMYLFFLLDLCCFSSIFVQKEKRNSPITTALEEITWTG